MRGCIKYQAREAYNNKPADLTVPWLGDLVKLWTVERERTLAVRKDTGVILNWRLGQPTERQKHGKSVLKHVADTLTISESELNRMRWFAYFDDGEKSCWGDIPEQDRTWTKFKKILPDLRAAEKGTKKCQRSVARKINEGQKSSSREKRADKRQDSSPTTGDEMPRGSSDLPTVDDVLNDIRSATNALRTEDFVVEDAKKTEVVDVLQDLLRAITEKTGMGFRLVTIGELAATA
jgi:hypothetical protein